MEEDGEGGGEGKERGVRERHVSGFLKVTGMSDLIKMLQKLTSPSLSLP